MGYRNEIYRANSAALPSVRSPSAPPAGSYCVPASLQDWQRRGWVAFEGLGTADNSATRSDAKDASIHGMSYVFHHCHEGSAEKILLRIDSWRYDRNGETTDLPIMEILFDAAQLSTPSRALESLKVMARPVRFTEKVASRTISAALFFINQINAGQVPDFERVLELHRIHPGLNREPGKTNDKKIRARAVSLNGPRGAAGGRSGEISETS